MRFFISYTRSDKDFAEQTRQSLIDWGFETWMDIHDIPPGSYWPDEIDKGLSSCDIVIGIMSPEALASRNVKNEWDWAIVNHKSLILMMCKKCQIPMNYISINYIDCVDSIDIGFVHLQSFLEKDNSIITGSEQFSEESNEQLSMLYEEALGFIKNKQNAEAVGVLREILEIDDFRDTKQKLGDTLYNLGYEEIQKKPYSVGYYTLEILEEAHDILNSHKSKTALTEAVFRNLVFTITYGNDRRYELLDKLRSLDSSRIGEICDLICKWIRDDIWYPDQLAEAVYQNDSYWREMRLGSCVPDIYEAIYEYGRQILGTDLSRFANILQLDDKQWTEKRSFEKGYKALRKMSAEDDLLGIHLADKLLAEATDWFRSLFSSGDSEAYTLFEILHNAIETEELLNLHEWILNQGVQNLQYFTIDEIVTLESWDERPLQQIIFDIALSLLKRYSEEHANQLVHTAELLGKQHEEWERYGAAFNALELIHNYNEELRDKYRDKRSLLQKKYYDSKR